MESSFSSLSVELITWFFNKINWLIFDSIIFILFWHIDIFVEKSVIKLSAVSEFEFVDMDKFNPFCLAVFMKLF